jgi:thymidylate synthase ThyX
MEKIETNDLEKISELVILFKKQVNQTQWVYVIMPKTSLSPEELAMIQSMYSRDPGSILHHLLEVAEKGASKFMQKFYVNYGHKSIGDCGNVLIAYEGVSMLAAKAIQDSQLYAGQEASTRYIDFSNQRFIGFDGDSQTNTVDEIMENWREFYLTNLPIVRASLFEKYPKNIWCEPGKEETYERTIGARAFDIMRGFLPAGATTAVAWWTSISHASEHLSWLRCHPLGEVKNLALTTLELLKEAVPGSFDRKIYNEREDYKSVWYENYYYLTLKTPKKVRLHIFDIEELSKYKYLFINRPKGQDLPWQLGELVTVQYDDSIDFGSFRDQQRHRAVIQRQGLLTNRFGMHDWYLENLPKETLTQAQKILFKEQNQRIEKLNLSDFDKQYVYPMGMKVPIRMTGSIAKFVYFIELRAQKTVHPTLHQNVLWLAKEIQNKMSFHLDELVLPLYVDSEIEITLKRGDQTILKKED